MISKNKTGFHALLAFLLVSYYSCGDRALNAPIEAEFEEQNPVISLLGDTLFALDESAATVLKKDSLLRIAHSNYQDNSENLENIIWYGRRLAYQYRYNEAIDVFSKGIVIFPESPELLRHRGHRYISIRKFDNAITDFEKAAKFVEGKDIAIEPDGMPNQLNIPLSSLQFNIYYHWALAHYLKGEFEKAEPLWVKCMEYSTNPDLLVATTDWYYMTLRRMKKSKEAEQLLNPITNEMKIIENASYHRRLLMYKGEVAPEELIDFENNSEEAQLDIVTQGYGVGNWYFYNGEEQKGMDIFKKIIDCPYWPAFGYIAAEADLYNLRKQK